MSKPKTKLIGNPWGSLAATNKEKQQAPKPPRVPRANACKPGSGRVNVAELSIDLEAVYDPTWKAPRPPGKYDALFERLPVGRAVSCKPEDCNTIAHALRNWGRTNGRNLDVKIDKNYRGTGGGKVFLVGEKAEQSA